MFQNNLLYLEHKIKIIIHCSSLVTVYRYIVFLFLVFQIISK